MQGDQLIFESLVVADVPLDSVLKARASCFSLFCWEERTFPGCKRVASGKKRKPVSPEESCSKKFLPIFA